MKPSGKSEIGGKHAMGPLKKAGTRSPAGHVKSTKFNNEHKAGKPKMAFSPANGKSKFSGKTSPSAYSSGKFQRPASKSGNSPYKKGGSPFVKKIDGVAATKRKQGSNGVPPGKKPRLVSNDDPVEKKKNSELTPEEKALQRKAQKARIEERKLERKPLYGLEKESAKAWETIRAANTSPEVRSRLVTEMLKQLSGKLKSLSLSHTTSRVIQACLRHCTPAERETALVELLPDLLPLVRSSYGHHIVAKLLDKGTKEQRTRILNALHGHAAALMRHPTGSAVMEQAYSLSTGTQRNAIVAEFILPEFALFQNTQAMPCRLRDILSEGGPTRRSSVVQRLAQAVQPILEKGIVDHSLVHRVLADYLSVASPGGLADAVGQLAGPLLLRMLHTREGVAVAITCLAAGTAKDRKKIVKALKTHTRKVAFDSHGHQFLLKIFDTVDDTVLVRKIVMSELLPLVAEMAEDKHACAVLLHLLAPASSRYFPPSTLSLLAGGVFAVTGVAKGQLPASRGGDAAEAPEGAPGASAAEGEGAEAEAGVGAEAAGEAEPGRPSGEEGEEEPEEAVVGVSKKDPQTRRVELLVGSGLAKALATACAENAGQFLRSKVACHLIEEVARGGAGGLLFKQKVDLAGVHRAIAEEAALAKDGGEEGQQHVLEEWFASRVLRRLVQEPVLSQPHGEAPPFVDVVWKMALRGRCSEWAAGHSLKVVAALASCTHGPTAKAARKELGPLETASELASVAHILENQPRVKRKR